MSLHQFYQYEQNPFFDLSAGPINQMNFFNIHSGRQEDELDGVKVMQKQNDLEEYLLI